MTGTTAVLTITGQPHEAEALASLRAALPANSILLARVGDAPLPAETMPVLPVTSLWSRDSVLGIVDALLGTSAAQFLWCLSPAAIVDPVGLRRLLESASDNGAALAYADFYEVKPDGATSLHPVTDYQPGSIRDDFDFGPLLVISRAALEEARAGLVKSPATSFAGLYDLRLRLTEAGPVFRLSDPIARRQLTDARKSGEKQFDYVDPRKRDYQVEMEQVATAHLARIGALLTAPKKPLVQDDATYPVEASVIIPVRNRAKTVGDAVKSALAQKAPFRFNVIVVDNHSEDGTTELLRDIAAQDDRLVHLIPERRDLGIGGCWNYAIYSEHCGRYAVQLDSDDLYDGEDVVSRVVAKFQEAPYALVIGSYTIVDFSLKQVPPGLIDHKEWTDENGMNNALRIHGMGAPRAYHVPTLRTIGFPNASYGEDYAVVVRMSREWQLGRIYESLYWCRRWEGNSDSALPLDTSNRYHAYKDRLRSIEVAARRALNGSSRP